jgi:hypothetical protein
LLVTVPLPDLLTVMGYVIWVNVAVTLFADVMLTWQVPVPLHAPPQPPKFHPFVAVAVNVTDVPLT